jgi:hypothetical protein
VQADSCHNHRKVDTDRKTRGLPARLRSNNFRSDWEKAKQIEIIFSVFQSLWEKSATASRHKNRCLVSTSHFEHSPNYRAARFESTLAAQ